MGLDIYIEKFEDYEDGRRRENEYERRSSAVWDECGKKYDDMTESEKQNARSRSKDIASELGLNEWGSQHSKKIERDSSIDPDHICKVGYFRSSYNDGGFNARVRAWFGDGNDLYYIFDVTREDDEIDVDWAATKARAIEIAEKIANLSDRLKTGVCFESKNRFANSHAYPKTSAEAMAAFEKQVAGKEKPKDGAEFGYGWSCLDGAFYPFDPLEVVGILPGTGSFDDSEGCYIVYKLSDDTMKHYENTARIVAETCDVLLAMTEEERAKHRVIWSA